MFDKIIYSEDETIIKVLVPGYGKEDLTITLEGNYLLVKSDDGGVCLKYRLAKSVDVDTIDAKCDKGILEIVLKDKQSEVKTITIK